jgi:hypothetical protein
MREWPELTGHIVGAARTLGWRAHHGRAGANRGGEYTTPIEGDPGYPDLSLLHTVVPVAIVAELKRFGRGRRSEPTADQQVWLELWGRLPGVYAVVWTTLDWVEHRIQPLLADPARVARLAQEVA